MKSLILVFMLVLFSFPALPQTFHWQNLNPVANDINDIQFVDAVTGFAVCSGGIILKTTDAGTTWKCTDVSTAVPCTLKKVFFTDNLFGWAIGTVSTSTPFFVRTTNGGTAWTVVPFTALTSLQAVCYRSHTLGWAVSSNGKIAKTTDGGTTWVVKESGVTNALYGIYFTSDLVGIAFATGGLVRKTTDGGDTWATGTPIQYDISAFQFLSPSLGFGAGGSANLYKTTDGGTSWIVMTSPSSSATYVDLHFVNENLGFVLRDAATSSASVYRTTDGGTTWTKPAMTSPQVGGICLHFINETTGFVCGRKGQISKTSDIGVNWTSTSTTMTTPIKDIFFDKTNEKLGWAVGFDNGGSTYGKTTDGGKNWAFKTPSFSKPYAVYFVNSNYGWISTDMGGIYKTTNAGETWVYQEAGAQYDHMYDIFFIDTLTGWTVGSNRVIKTTDGGTTWTTQLSAVSNAGGNCIYFIDANHGFKGSSTNGYTTDGGTTWQNLSSFSIIGNTITFANNQIGWAAGSGGVIKTTDAGLTWKQCTGLSNAYCFGLACTDTSNVWAAGTNGGIWRSTDGGTTWARVPALLSGEFATIAARGSNVWAGGANGAIVSTIDAFSAIGGDFRNSAQRKSLELNQNFPNPFNPTTTISFSLTEPQTVTLTLFNQLGETVTVLLSGEMTRGEHAVKWDASAYPSGIYFYRLSTKNGTSVKKLMLLK